MRVLITTDTIGGVWTFTSELTRQLLGRGHSVHLVSFGREPSPEQQATADAFRTGFPSAFTYTASEIPLEWMQNNERAHTDGEPLLLDLLQKSGADVLLSNQFCFGRLQSSVPRIVVAHSDVLSWARACRPSALEPSPWLNRYTALVQSGLLDATALITPTDSMGRSLVANFFLPQRYLVIANGVSVEPTSAPSSERLLQAITAGRLWDEGKGLDTLRDVQSPIPLLVAGDNTLHPGESSGNWPAHLRDLGALSRSDLHQHFRESAIYICPSRYEPFGLAAMEAALCGCAVVARDLPSLREVWADNAIYFRDAAQLELILRALAEDPEKLAQAQGRAWQRATLFTTERMGNSYLHLFQTVLQQQAVPHGT